MKIAIDESPLTSGNALQHKVRGSGFYLLELKKALLAAHSDNKFLFFTRGEKLPSDIDILHIPYFEPFFISLPLWNTNKSVVTIHDLTPLIYPELFPAGFKGKLKLVLQKVLLRNYRAIITDSDASKEDISKILGIPRQKINVVYLAAANHFTQKTYSKEELQKIRKKYSIPQKFVLYVGDATRNKNLPRLLQAADIAHIPVVIAGKALSQPVAEKENEWNADLLMVQKAARENPNVHILGFVPDEDLVALYNMATFTAMVSLYEGFGLPVLEAMQSGCPVVTSKLGSLPEVAGDAALYVDAFDAHSIADGLLKVFNDSRLRAKMSEKGLKQAKKFSWGKTAQNTVKVYEKVAHS